MKRAARIAVTRVSRLDVPRALNILLEAPPPMPRPPPSLRCMRITPIIASVMKICKINRIVIVNTILLIYALPICIAYKWEMVNKKDSPDIQT